MTGVVRFYPGATQTLDNKTKQQIQDNLENALSKSSVFKRAEVATLGEVYYDPKWRQTKKILVTTMHVARLMKR